ncbi:hypothetical protein THRCLA_09396 [Thraustotheca clavata]|uniref:E3 ubiquitin-protein ligase n=1 Tax=Thraustotheca clavata TaxID=74557 RepID=A0A1V9YX61_9STRA|nr:hypothetical protein THRCLA_09396 [Thraustotheca clavata]
MSHLATPTAFGSFIDERLRVEEHDVLEEGWLQSLLDYGHAPSRFPDFLEAILAASIRASTTASFPSVAAYLRQIHQAHELTVPRRVCGYMFKQNDISWSCRDCEMDETCVLCQTCFQNSNHEGHQVFFHRTSPGGMCDCGDAEAWRPEGMCPAHKCDSSAENPPSDAHLLELPAPLKKTLHCVLYELILYMVDVAVRTSNAHEIAKISRGLNKRKRKHTEDMIKLYHVRIANDDVHTDQDLTGLLMDKGYSVEFAEQFTQAVDAKGSQLLKENIVLKEAIDLMKSMEAEGWLSCVVDNEHLLREDVWEICFNYILNLTLISPTVQSELFAILFDTMFHAKQHYKYAPREMEPIVELLTASSILKKSLVQGLMQAYLNLMGNRELKWQFSNFYVEVYQQVMRDFFCGVGTKNESIFGLSVQIFTTPSIVPALVEDRALLSILLHVLQDGLEMTRIPDKANPDLTVVNLEHIVVRFNRYELVITDMCFVLLVPTVAQSFATTEYLKQYYSILHDLAHLNMQVRVAEHQPHIELEDTMPWYNALTLHVSLASITQSFFKGLRTLSNVLSSALGNTIFQVIWAELAQDLFIYHTVPHYTLREIPKYYVDEEPVSFHYPLHQTFGYFILEMLQRGEIPLLDILNTVQTTWDPLIEIPLRSFVFSAQISSNFWVRNGMELMNHEVTSYYDQSYYFPNLTSHLCFRDIDLVLLQVSALLLGPEAFFAIYLDRFGLYDYLNPNQNNRQHSWYHLSSNDKQTQYVAEALLKLLWIVTELPPPRDQGVQVQLRRKMVHFLTYKSCVYSTLRDHATTLYAQPAFESVPEDARNKYLLQIVNDIAEAIPQADSIAPSKFTLKANCYSEYDPSYLHLSSSRHIKAQEIRQENVYKTWRVDSDVTIPLVSALPECHLEMAQVRTLVLLPQLCCFLRQVLQHPVLSQDDTLFGRIVHLLTVQLIVLKAHPEMKASLLDEIKQATTGMDKTMQFNFEPSSRQSILQILSQKAISLKSHNDASLKPLLSGILHVLKKYMQLDQDIARELETSVFPKQIPNNASTNGPMDHKARLALQKQKQQQAMAAMMQRQSQFATMLDDDELSDEDIDATATTRYEQPTPECIICSQIRKDDPVMYIGLAQKSSSLRPHQFHKSTSTIHVQLCGHAIHLSCVEKYCMTMVRDVVAQSINATPLHLVAFDPAVGEFLCPLCKSLSSTFLPFVPRPTSGETQHSLEHFFEKASSVQSTLYHLEVSLPELLRQPAKEIPAFAKVAMESFLKSMGLDLVRTKRADIIQTVLDTIEHTFDAGQTQGISAALIHLAFASSNQLTLRSQLGINLSSEAESYLDPFTPRDDAKFHALFHVLHYLPALLPSSKTYEQVIPYSIADAIDGKISTLFPSLVENGMVPMLGLPLLGQDLFAVLLLVCSSLTGKADMLWAIRAFASVHMVQTMLVCTQPVLIDQNGAHDNVETGAFDFAKNGDYSSQDDSCICSQEADENALSKWRESLAKALGIQIHPHAPTGALLKCTFETTSLVFLRKATLLARAIFRGPDDPDGALYANFITNLHLTTKFTEMCRQLGAPSPLDIMTSESFSAFITKQLSLFHSINLPHSWKLKSTQSPMLNTLSYLPQAAVEMYNKSPWAVHLHVTGLSPMYTDFYALHNTHVCPWSKQPMEIIAICMRCGEAVCAGSDCCKVNGKGACSLHVEHCGHGNSAFFLLKQCSILLVGEHGRASLFSSPYVDEFGEEDLYVKRGRPLYLAPKRLMVLFQLIVSHSIAIEVSKARRTSEQYIRAYYY